MILKKLEIQGFKSFADRTEVVFTSGVTAVVGPNGSGKSNISDAILWVLGEQNVRTLRGQKVQDVIFSGTDKRRATGMAEVCLTVDNSSGKLPLEYGEVTIMRRAYRSGESEFFINKSPCRLKDIYELFMDTGVGREAYSIVSQGEMDAVLSARPEDRRALFDEAAGIKKYRHRKKEAERKLDNVQQNLDRVNDIVTELGEQVEPMAEQAEIAKRYIELATRLREIEVGILVTDLRRCTTDIQNIRSEKDTNAKSIADFEALLAALDEEKSALAVDLANADAQAERFAANHQEALTHAERTESRLALVNEKHTSAGSSQLRLTEEIAELERRITQIEEQRSGISSDQEKAQKEEADLNARLAAKTAELEAIQREMDLAARRADEQKSNYIELAKRLAAQRNELTNAGARIENLRMLLTRRSQELSEARTAAERASAERATWEESLSGIRVELAAVAEEMSKLRAEVEAKQTALKDVGSNFERLTRLMVDKKSRLKTLVEMEDAKEGYFFGVRSVTSALKAGKLTGNYSVVSDVVTVPKGYETAFEVALGASLQDIITDSEAEAKSAIELLKRTSGGRATFLPLKMMRHNASPMLKDLIGKNGILGLGNDLLKFDKKYAPAIDALLSRVLVAEDIDAAVAASKSAMGWSKIVTLGGELVLPSGAMTGGHAPNKNVNILGRKSEIESLGVEVRELEKETVSLEKRSTTLSAEAEDLSVALRAKEEKDTALKMSLLEGERRLEFALRESKRLAEELESSAAEKENIEENLQKAQETQSVLKTAIESADMENSSLDGQMSETGEKTGKLQAEYDRLTAEINSTSILLASLVQKKIGMEKTSDGFDTAIGELTMEIRRKKEQLSNAKEEGSSTEERRVELEAEIAKARVACAETHAQAEQWRKTKQAVLSSSFEVNDRIKDVGRKREDLTQKVHAADLREARLDMQISQASERLVEEYELSPEDALLMELPDNRQGSSAEVIRLRREIRGMGEVNTGAVQEYARLTERYDFLRTQREDLVSARNDLIKAIREIDDSTLGMFMETFEAVSLHFGKMFTRLFGGGSTELILTEPSDILETGIDVVVELPGKKRQNLHLLSGGERALTAAALIFALMSVRPSPFCVMDEVDAPLDEANVERFADVIKEFAEHSQMIVITHNKGTMEAADVLYGVTMTEPGVSTVMSVKMS